MREQPLLTVFTPAFNRAHTIGRTYQSLLNQSNKSFIWLIIDDGSSDETEALVKSWMERENGFEIQYIKKENGGMHTAHNVAYRHINTELNVCIDSDDTMADDAVDIIVKAWNRVRNKVRNKGYAGLIGLDAEMHNGQIIGTGFPENLKETTLVQYYANGGSGDKKLVYRTDIINSVPEYPVFEGERYVSLAYKYRLIDQRYKLYVINDILCNVEYQKDGSSGTMWKQYLVNPRGFAFWRKTAMQFPESRKRLVIDCIHYCSSSFIAKNSRYIEESPKKALTLLCTPAGWLLSRITYHKARHL